MKTMKRREPLCSAWWMDSSNMDTYRRQECSSRIQPMALSPCRGRTENRSTRLIQPCTRIFLFLLACGAWLPGSINAYAIFREVEVAEDGMGEYVSIPGQSSSNLRSPPRTKTVLKQDFVHENVIRRVYGPDNRGVRKAIREIVERMPRFQTGIPPDLDHIIPYENHPYDRTARYLTTSNTTQSPTTTNSNFQPMRIVFKTIALDNIRTSDNAAKIDWYKNVILPRTAEFWSQALSVVPISGNLRISSSELDNFAYCGDSAFTEVPDEDKSTGISNADLLLYVSGSNDQRFCPDRTLAVAVPCNFDQFDRPIAGAVNVCLDNIVLQSDGTATDDVVQDYVDVTVHEVGHVLGHSDNSYRFYWDSETGTPRTARPFESRTVTCVDGTVRSLILPDTNTLQFVLTDDGRRYATIVTPKVQAVARNQFDCQSLEGGQLENQPTRADSCMGDHWDERLYYPEAMSAVISPTTNIFSALTLAIMEDSGWYLANYTTSKMSPWGLGAGCDFANSLCLSPNSSDIPDYSRGFFCNQANAKGCSPEHSTKLACTIIDYYYYVPQTLPPKPYIYFPSEPSKGGPEQADYCPVYGSTYDSLKASDLSCNNPNKEGYINFYSEVYAEDSKCIESNAGEGLCYRTACVQDTMTMSINVLGVWYECKYDFQPITVRLAAQGLLEVTLTCPRLSQACPDLFCPFQCAGRGTCNYSNTVNGTIRPVCECFDSTDTSPACSNSLIPNGGFLNDSSGLRNNLEQGFFDPLIAVFVDHPDAWQSASWAWAGGMIFVFMILLTCICSSFCPTTWRKSASASSPSVPAPILKSSGKL